MKINAKDRFFKRQESLLNQIEDIAGKLKCKVYLVGGIVRDIILGIENFDLDIVVVGNGMNFAQVLAKKINSSITVYPKFKTAKIFIDNLHIDIASARKEHYQSSGALPEVIYSDLYQDLLRRDFTINSLAISLNLEDYLKIIDIFDGINDLKKGIIRVLHDKSFIDDPTRIFRAIRFKARFNYKFSPKTLQLINEALAQKVFKNISRSRVKNELEILLKEPNPWKSLEVLYKFTEFCFLDISSQVKMEDIKRLHRSVSWYKSVYKSYQLNIECLFFMFLFSFSLKNLDTSGFNFRKNTIKAINRIGFIFELANNFNNKSNHKKHLDFLKDLSPEEMVIFHYFLGKKEQTALGSILSV